MGVNFPTPEQQRNMSSRDLLSALPRDVATLITDRHPNCTPKPFFILHEDRRRRAFVTFWNDRSTNLHRAALLTMGIGEQSFLGGSGSYHEYGYDSLGRIATHLDLRLSHWNIVRGLSGYGSLNPDYCTNFTAITYLHQAGGEIALSVPFRLPDLEDPRLSNLGELDGVTLTEKAQHGEVWVPKRCGKHVGLCPYNPISRWPGLVPAGRIWQARIFFDGIPEGQALTNFTVDAGFVTDAHPTEKQLEGFQRAVIAAGYDFRVFPSARPLDEDGEYLLPVPVTTQMLTLG